MGWLCRYPGIVWEPIWKWAYTQLVREHLAYIISARWATVDWSWHKEWNQCARDNLHFTKNTGRERTVESPQARKSHYHFTLQCLSLPDCWQWTRCLPFASSYVSEFLQLSKKLKSRRKSQNQQKCLCSRWLTASSQQNVANQHQVFNVIYNALWVKQQIFPSKNNSKWLAIWQQIDELCMWTKSRTY